MARRRNVWTIVWIGLAVSLLLAGVVSYYASSSPDGLEKVAADIGLGEHAQESAVAGSPLSDYGVAGVENARMSVGLAGLIGVLLTGVLAFGLFAWLARRNRRQGSVAG